MPDESESVTAKRLEILRNATAAFLRYGYDRTSMADIADGAGMSRTALYHYFSGKDDVLRAAIEELHARTAEAAARVVAEAETLQAALSGLMAAKFGRTLDLIGASPHGNDLVDASHRLTGPATRVADAAFRALVVDALVRHGSRTEADAVADTLVAAAKGLMRSDERHVDRATFDDRVRRLIGWLVD